MIKIAVVEDDKTCSDLIISYIKKYGRENKLEFSITTYEDGYDIAESYDDSYAVIFLDIEMKIMNGLEAAEKIRQRDQQTVIIFVTNTIQYAIRGYSVNALDYVLKPLSYYAFSQSMKKAMNVATREKDRYVTISTRSGIEKIAISHICWIESQGHRLTFHTEDDTPDTTVYSMKDIETNLSGDGFRRCNNGCLVNLSKVMAINGNQVVMADGAVLPISRGRKNGFITDLTAHITG
jgi:DNA-binding LytR/AlgR family response regulator